MISTKINPNTIEFLKQLIEQNAPQDFNITFFGGEPLMYQENLKYIVEELKEYSNVSFSISTNGSLLTKELVNYFNKNRIYVGLSWDGKNTVITRKTDVLANEKLRNLFFDLDQKEVMCVFSSETYPKQFLEDMHNLRYLYWVKTGKETIPFRYEIIMDHGIPDNSMLQLDLNRVYTDMKDLCTTYKTYLNGSPVSTALIEFIERLLNIVSIEFKRTDYFYTAPRCFQMSSLLSLSTEGKFHYCHSSDKTFGDISQDFDSLLKNYDGHDYITELCKTKCHKCTVVPFCKGGCPLIRNEKRPFYCETIKAFYEPVIDLIHYVNNRNNNNV